MADASVFTAAVDGVRMLVEIFEWALRELNAPNAGDFFWAENPRVGSSIPPLATIDSIF
jgi:hypothetical protein